MGSSSGYVCKASGTRAMTPTRVASERYNRALKAAERAYWRTIHEAIRTYADGLDHAAALAARSRAIERAECIYQEAI